MRSSSTRAEAQVDRLIESLHSSRLRVWSIIISFFGDAITPRGGVLWLSTFRPLAARMGIESGTVGAAMSRLTAEGLLVREKRGRHTLYRVAASERDLFELATKQIYRPDKQKPWNGRWQLVMLDNADEMPDGFAHLNEHTWIRPDVGPAPKLPAGAVVFSATAEHTPALRRMVHRTWELDAIEAGYDRWRAQFSGLAAAIEAGDTLPPMSAMCARLLLIHGFRRVVLKDPSLPDALRDKRWPGFEARAMAADLYRALLPQSEALLDAPDATPEGPLPRPKASFYRRFGGLR